MIETNALLARIADALERLAPPPAPLPDSGANVLVWDGPARTLLPIETPPRVPIDMILGADTQKTRLLANIARFAEDHPANHALLWGSRGTGKSAVVKAVHANVSKQHPELKLIEVARADIASVPALADIISKSGWRAILFIDDLSFERGDESYKALKTLLDGGVSGSMSRILVCVTSNRRHLVNRPDGTQADFRPDETVDEQMALSERFGLWLGFHPMDQATWLTIVRNYATRLDLKPKDKHLERAALQWASSRGARTGRSAWQFIVERAGEMGKPVKL
jgi:predicted AAA+ superfamily ATPase